MAGRGWLGARQWYAGQASLRGEWVLVMTVTRNLKTEGRSLAWFGGELQFAAHEVAQNFG